jgi:hypothetical protein
MVEVEIAIKISEKRVIVFKQQTHSHENHSKSTKSLFVFKLIVRHIKLEK